MKKEYIEDLVFGERLLISIDADAFKRGIEQGCRVIVLDLDMHMSEQLLHPNQIAKHLLWRPDFSNEQIHICYVVYRGRAVEIRSELRTRAQISAVLEKLKAER